MFETATEDKQTSNLSSLICCDREAADWCKKVFWNERTRRHQRKSVSSTAKRQLDENIRQRFTTVKRNSRFQREVYANKVSFVLRNDALHWLFTTIRLKNSQAEMPRETSFVH